MSESISTNSGVFKYVLFFYISLLVPWDPAMQGYSMLVTRDNPRADSFSSLSVCLSVCLFVCMAEFTRVSLWGYSQVQSTLVGFFVRCGVNPTMNVF